MLVGVQAHRQDFTPQTSDPDGVLGVGVIFGAFGLIGDLPDQALYVERTAIMRRA